MKELILVYPDNKALVYGEVFKDLKPLRIATENNEVKRSKILAHLTANKNLLRFLQDFEFPLSNLIKLQLEYARGLASIRIRELVPFPELDQFPAFYSGRRILGEGAFGCVLRFDVRKEKGYNGADWVVSKIEVPKTQVRWVSEVSSLKKGSTLRRLMINPFNLLYFRSYVINLKKGRNMSKLKGFIDFNNPETCDKLKGKIRTSELAGSKILVNVIEMEFVPKTLKKAPFPTEKQLASTVFQLVYSLLVNHLTFDLLHNDIKEENILVNDNYTGYRYRFHLASGKFLLDFSARGGPYLVHFADFGSSLNDEYPFSKKFNLPAVFQHRSGTAKYIPPEIYLYYKLKESVDRQVVPIRGIESDIWSLGMTLLYLLTRTPVKDQLFKVGRDLPQFRSDLKSRTGFNLTAPGEKDPQTNEPTHVITTQMVNFSLQIPLILAVFDEKLPTTPIGNFKFGGYKTVLERYSKSTEFMSKYESRIKGIKKSVIDKAGVGGFEFIKKCLAVSFVERREFAKAGLLKHEMFDSIRVQEFDYTPTTVQTEDFFFPI